MFYSLKLFKIILKIIKFFSLGSIFNIGGDSGAGQEGVCRLSPNLQTYKKKPFNIKLLWAQEFQIRHIQPEVLSYAP